MIKKIFIFLAVSFLSAVVILFGLNIIAEAVMKNSEPSLNKPQNSEIADKSEDNTTTEETTEATTVIYRAEISAVGDLMVHQWQMDNAYNNGEYNFDYTFEPVYDYLQNADLAVGNLETVFAGKDIGYSDYPCFNTPDSFATAIKKAGFDVLTTANNHSADKGMNGILRTIEVLDNTGLEHFGTYSSQDKRDEPFIKEVNGIRIGFVSATYGINGNYIPEDKKYLVNILDEKLITADIERVKEENPDFIIVMPHLGNEYESYPKDVFKNWIDIMIKAGADMVIASHPHVLQPMEWREVTLDDGSVKRAFVAYSMANFISSQRDIPRDTGVILNFTLKKYNDDKAFIEEIGYIPTWVQWRDTSGQYNIRVISIYDALSDIESGGNKYKLRDKDITRLRAAHKEALTAIGQNDTESFAQKYMINVR